MITRLAHVPILDRSVFFVGNCEAVDAEEAAYRLRRVRTQVSFVASSHGGVRDCGGDVFVWVKDLSKAKTSRRTSWPMQHAQ